jgi:hypothetical protein
MRAFTCLILFLAALARPADADGIEVDVELLLLVDVSRSMSPGELEIQRRGYAEALRSAPVLAAIRSGLLARVAMSYVEWAGLGTQRVVVDWRLLETRDDLDAFADVLANEFNPALRRTSISSALDYGARSIRDNGYQGLRRVIDVSGDGPNNAGRPVLPARDAAIADGIVINGLPLMTREGMGSQWHLDDLDEYYRHCVIGGPGAFVIPVHDWAGFAEAVRRKLVLEIAGLPPTRVIRAQYRPAPAYDCLIGEKIWERNRRYWDQP